MTDRKSEPGERHAATDDARRAHDPTTGKVQHMILTDEQIATLNAARTVLNDVAERAGQAAWSARTDTFSVGEPRPEDYGRASEAAASAEHAIFHALNVADSYSVRSMSQVQLHNYRGEQPQHDGNDEHSRRVPA